MEKILPIADDTVLLGILLAVLAFVFYTSSFSSGFFFKLYKIIPPVLLCYILPALLSWPLGIISIKETSLYTVSSRYLLPASLLLFCLSIDIKSLLQLGPKAIIIFLAATLSIVFGGPFSLFVSIQLFGDGIGFNHEELWRGMSTIAGSWIGGGANQTAMKEIFDVNESIFASMIVVDIIIANIWMGFLLYGATISERVDRWLKSDSSYFQKMALQSEQLQKQQESAPSTKDLFILAGISFGGVSMAHWISSQVVPLLQFHEGTLKQWRLDSLLTHFFWLVVLATTFGVLLSFTRARKFEGMGASKFGTLFLYILVATIGMQMNLKDLFSHPALLITGGIWMLFHIVILLVVAKIIKAPFFLVAISSQANIGGAASAPIVATAFHPALATLGVILAVIGYALGTYGGILSAYMMQWVSIG